MAHIVVARAAIARQVARNRRKNASGREGQKSTIGNRVDAVAPGVVCLHLQSVPEPFLRSQLQSVVVAVRTGGELRHRSETRIDGRAIRKGSKATCTNRLI